MDALKACCFIASWKPGTWNVRVEASGGRTIALADGRVRRATREERRVDV